MGRLIDVVCILLNILHLVFCLHSMMRGLVVAYLAMTLMVAVAQLDSKSVRYEVKYTDLLQSPTLTL